MIISPFVCVQKPQAEINACDSLEIFLFQILCFVSIVAFLYLNQKSLIIVNCVQMFRDQALTLNICVLFARIILRQSTVWNVTC